MTDAERAVVEAAMKVVAQDEQYGGPDLDRLLAATPAGELLQAVRAYRKTIADVLAGHCVSDAHIFPVIDETARDGGYFCRCRERVISVRGGFAMEGPATSFLGVERT